MLYIQIVTWLFFIIVSLIYLTTLIIPLATIKENKNIPLLYIVPSLISTFLFLISNEIFEIKNTIIIWKILSILPILFTISITLFSKYRNSYTLLSLISTTAIGIIPFLINIEIQKTNTLLPIIKNTYSYDFVLSVSLLFIIILILSVYSISNRRNRIILNSLNDIYIRINNDKNKNKEPFRATYEKLLWEELNKSLMDFRRTLNKSTIDLKDIIELEHTVKLRNNKKSDEIYPILYEIKKEIEKIKEPSNSNNLGINNLDIIRELNHFLATPFSSIITNCELLKRQIISKRNISNANIHIDRIISSTKLCQCVIKAYREITNVSNSFVDSQQTIKQGLQDAFSLYSTEYQKDGIEFSNNIADNLSGYSNNLIISLISPLLQNAVYASPEYETIYLDCKEEQHRYTISISNKYSIKPDLVAMDNVGYSSKENHTGTGLLIVRHILQLRDSGELSYEIKNDEIIFNLYLKK